MDKVRQNCIPFLCVLCYGSFASLTYRYHVGNVRRPPSFAKIASWCTLSWRPLHSGQPVVGLSWTILYRHILVLHVGLPPSTILNLPRILGNHLRKLRMRSDQGMRHIATWETELRQSCQSPSAGLWSRLLQWICLEICQRMKLVCVVCVCVV